MDKLDKYIDFFKGKKTFCVAFLMMILGVLTDNREMILEGLGLLAIRDAIGWGKKEEAV